MFTIRQCACGVEHFDGDDSSRVSLLVSLSVPDEALLHGFCSVPPGAGATAPMASSLCHRVRVEGLLGARIFDCIHCTMNGHTQNLDKMMALGITCLAKGYYPA